MAIAFKGSAAAAEEANQFPVAPEGGPYYLKVLKATERKSKETKRDMIEMELVINEGEHKDIHVWHYLTFIEAGAKGHGMTLIALKAFGFDPEGDITIGGGDFEGLVVSVQLGQETYKGKKKNVIAEFNVPEQSADEAPAQDEQQPPEPTPPPAPKPVAAAKPAPAPARRLPWAKK